MSEKKQQADPTYRYVTYTLLGHEGFTSGYDAIRQMLDGYSSEQVAVWLIEAGYWPESLSMGGAAARVRTCIRPDGDQFFKFAEIIYLAWRTGRPYPIYYACDELGLTRPEPRDMDSEMKALAEEVPALEAELDMKRRRLETLMQGRGPGDQRDANGRRLRFRHGDRP